MRCLTLTLVPHDRAMFSRTAATEGVHETLAGPTGAALLGWTAGRLYAEFARQGIAGVVFHDGLVRFSNAVRLCDEAPAFARPEALLRPKHAGGVPVLGRKAFADTYGTNVQPEAAGMMELTLAGHMAQRARVSHRLRNSRMNDTMFGNQAVEPEGMAYRATIETDDGVLIDAQWQQLCEAFSGELILGRARGTDSGGSYACTSKTSDASFWPQPTDITADTLHGWLLSDAALADDYGNPAMVLTAANAGLPPGWVLDENESAIRSRRFAPWNGALQTRDSEIAVIEAGGLFTYCWRGTGPTPTVTPPTLVGGQRHRGLGRIAWITDLTVETDKAVGTGQPPAETARTPPSTLASWAKVRSKEAETQVGADSWLKETAKYLGELFAQIGEAWPAASQWSGLTESSDWETLRFGQAWQPIIFPPEDPNKSAMGLGEWILRVLGDCRSTGISYPQALAGLVSIARGFAKGARR